MIFTAVGRRLFFRSLFKRQLDSGLKDDNLRIQLLTIYLMIVSI